MTDEPAGERSTDGEPVAPRADTPQPDGPASLPPATERLVIQRVADGPHTRWQRGRDRRRRRHRRRLIGRILLGAGALLLVIAAWTGFRAYQCYSNLAAARAELADLKSQLTGVSAGQVDLAAVGADLARIQESTGAAAGAARDPFLSAVTVIPWVGDNLDALRQAALGSDDIVVAGQHLVSLAETTSRDTILADGRIDVEALRRLSIGTTELAEAVASADERIDSVDTGRLVGPAAAAVRDLSAMLGSVRPVTDQVGGWGRILPGLLGADGPRDYLVVFQNLGETRTTGGIFGSYAVLRVDDGQLSILDQGPTDRRLGRFDPPVAGAPDLIYGDLPRVFPQNVNLSADFPTAATLISTMYTQSTGTEVDGVLALDPVALSYLLADHPPIDAGDLTLTAETLVRTLLADIYATYPSGLDIEERDAATSRALVAAFRSVVDTPSDLGTWVSALHRGAQESRILFWSSDPAEQQTVVSTSLGGSLDRRVGPETAGLFLNDSAGTKLEYYLSATSAVSTTGCDNDRAAVVVTTLRNDAPEDLPPYVMGTGVGRDRVIRLDLAAYAPTGGHLTEVTVDGAPVDQAILNTSVGPASFFTVQVPPGEQVVVRIVLAMPPGGELTTLDTTPLATPWPVEFATMPDCGR